VGRGLSSSAVQALALMGTWGYLVLGVLWHPVCACARVRASAREPSKVDDVAHIGTARAAKPAQRDHQFYTRLNDAPVAHLRVVASQIRRDVREHG